MSYLTWALDHYVEILEALFAIVGVCAKIAAWTPSPKDDAAAGIANKVLVKLRWVIDNVGGNYGHAKNAEPDAPEPAKTKPEASEPVKSDP